MSKKKAVAAPTTAELDALNAKNSGSVMHEDTQELGYNCNIVETSMESQFDGSETREKLVSKLAQLRKGDDNYNSGASTMIGTTLANQKAINSMLLKHGLKPAATMGKYDGTAMYLWVLFTEAVKKPKTKKKAAKKK